MGRNTNTVLVCQVLPEGTICQFGFIGKITNISQKDHENKFTLKSVNNCFSFNVFNIKIYSKCLERVKNLLTLKPFPTLSGKSITEK